ncbi:hypothetical protein EUA78_00750 [TM7 phylum sp. oral taxon 351]|nr:hypothetical protein EUA78_00750 [TM7 phylum sp. oral taxon 351]
MPNPNQISPNTNPHPPAFHEHTSSGFCWQIIVKSGNRQSLLAAIRSLDNFPDLRISIDPPSLL